MSEHQLVHNGWPHDERGNPYLNNYGDGCAKCSCGKLSPPGDATFRRHWIAAHRRILLAARR